MTITVTAFASFDWSFINFFDELTGAVQKSASGVTSLTLLNNSALPWFDARTTLNGTGLSTDASGAVTAGTVSSFTISGTTGSPVYTTMTFSTPISAVTLWSGMKQFADTGNAPTLATIFRNTEAYVFNGGAADDFFEGSNLADTISGAGGDDVLIGLDGDDTINGGAGDDYIDGGNGNNTLVGGAGDDWLVGGTGVNLMSAGLGVDYVDGSLGANDTLTFAAATAGIGVDLVLGVGTAGEARGDTYVDIEKFIGSSFNDTMIGATATIADWFVGGKGNDLFFGHRGADTLDGGDGIDTVSYADAPASSGVAVDLVNGGPVGWPESTGDVYIDIENVIGSDGLDGLLGNAKNNRLYGGLQNDDLEGRGGSDTLIGGDGFDRAVYWDSLVGVTVDLRLTTAQVSQGDAAGDVLSGIEGIAGSDLSDRLIGNAGDNRLFSSLHPTSTLDSDTLIGGAGADTIVGSAGSFASYETAAAGVIANLTTEALNTGDAAGDIYGAAVRNLIGSNFADTLIGDSSSNILRGGSGKDALDGKAGADVLTGGAGRDRFVFGNGGGQDSITDFVAGSLGDYLDLRGVSNLTFYQSLLSPGVMTQSGSDVTIDLSSFTGTAGDSITLQHVTLGSLKPLNFIIN